MWFEEDSGARATPLRRALLICFVFLRSRARAVFLRVCVLAQGRLEAMRAALLTRASVVVNLSGDAATLAAAQPAAARFLAKMPSAPPQCGRATWDTALARPPRVDEGFVVPTQVSAWTRGSSCPPRLVRGRGVRRAHPG